jgi:hypothetical protein
MSAEPKWRLSMGQVCRDGEPVIDACPAADEVAPLGELIADANRGTPAIDWSLVWSELAAWRREAEGISAPVRSYLTRKVEELVARQINP